MHPSINRAGKADYRPALVSYISRQALPPEKFSHQPRVYQLAWQLAEDHAYDDDVLFAAAWMHDIGVFVGHRPEEPAALGAWDHIGYAINVVPALLERFGFPREKIPAVLEVIRTHLPSSEPVSFEGVLLRDADILEQLGAVGILRAACKVGRDTRFRLYSDVLQVLRKNLAELPSCLNLPLARSLAEPRIELLRSFLVAAESEAGNTDL